MGNKSCLDVMYFKMLSGALLDHLFELDQRVCMCMKVFVTQLKAMCTVLFANPVNHLEHLLAFPV